MEKHKERRGINREIGKEHVDDGTREEGSGVERGGKNKLGRLEEPRERVRVGK